MHTSGQGGQSYLAVLVIRNNARTDNRRGRGSISRIHQHSDSSSLSDRNNSNSAYDWSIISL